MARAFMVVVRNDMPDSLLQVLDLKPNPTPSIGSRIYDGAPQGGYQTFFLLDGVNLPVATQAGAGGGASLDVTVDTYGLSAYLLDHVEDTGGNESLTAAEAITIAGLIETDVANATAITLARINVHINTPAGVAASDLDGTLGNSTGSVLEALRILSGERWKLPALSQVRVNAGTFDATVRGFFVTAANVETPDSIRTTHTNARGLRGRASTAPLSHIRPGEPTGGNTPVNTGTQDTNHQDVRVTVDTGDIHLSATNGALAELKNNAYVFFNTAFDYVAGGTQTRASDIGGTNLPVTGAGRAVVVYDALGNLI